MVSIKDLSLAVEALAIVARMNPNIASW